MNKPTFKEICLMYIQQLTNFPYIEKDFDALTDYGLLCKVVDKLNEVITNTNLQDGYIVNLYNAFIELKTYVDNYLDSDNFQVIVDNKLDEMAQDGTLENLININILNNKLDYYKINTSMSENDIITIIENGSRAKVIEFETGLYEFTRTIHITSNTKFILNGSTLKTNDYHNMFLFYKDTDIFTSYDGVHDVIFENGNISISSALMHNSNITFNNINFLNELVTHAIQIAGSKNIKITNCTFNGIVLNDTIGNNTELIQLETCTSNGQPYISSSSPMFNNLGNFNIEISNCIFNKGDGINSKFYVGIGHHSRDVNNIYSQENIRIINNKFYNPTYSAISIFGLNNSEISGNYFELTDNISGNITMRFRGENKYVLIENNIINGFKVGIDFVNIGQCENYIINNNKFIADNNISTNSIALKGMENCKIINNQIDFHDYGIYILPQDSLNTENIIISNNNFKGTISEHNHCIRCNANSYNVKIFDNYFKQLNANTNFVFYIAGDSELTKPLYYINNYIENEVGNVNDISRNANINFSNIYNSLNNLYTATSTYVELTNQAPNWSFAEFNRLKIVMAIKNQGNRIFEETIHGYSPYNKLLVSNDVNRTFGFILPDSSGNTHVANFTINTDGTFNFSSDGEISLISLNAYNSLEL